MEEIKKISRREEIIEVAAQLFKKKGFNATSMRDIAAGVGIEAASMYNHIASKNEILEVICFTISDKFISQLSDIEKSNLTPIEKIKSLIKLHIKIQTEDTCNVSVMETDWKHLQEKAFLKLKADRKNYEMRFAAIIQAGIDQGQIQTLNPSVILLTLLSSISWIEHWYKESRGISPEELEKSIVSLLINGIKNNV